VLRFFEQLVNPYGSYEQTDTPPQRLWPFLRDYIRPFRGVFVVTAISAVLVASFDVVLIWYVGRMVDLLSQGTPAAVLASHGWEIAFVAFVILIVRPVVGGAHVALLHNTILPNFGTMIRYRAHRHVLRQPVGWFESDFAGRLANRIMQTPPAAGEAVCVCDDPWCGGYSGGCGCAAAGPVGGVVWAVRDAGAVDAGACGACGDGEF
jgi:ATP-binding cassette, subfamily B, multidrug efflux pump